MAVGWKSLAGIVGAASVVSVGTLYSVLVREPAPSPQPASQAMSTQSVQPAGMSAPPADVQKTAQAPSAPDQTATKPVSQQPDASQHAVTQPETPKPATAAAPESPKPASGGQAKVPQTQAGQTQAAQAPVSKEQALPSFDIARIEPGGDAVIAGSAAPGATVELRRNGNAYARAVADVGGQWAIVPPTLPKGTGELTLRSTTPDGRVAQSQQTVSVRVPEKPGEEVVVVLNTPDQPSKVLTDAAPPAGKPVANPQVAAAQPTQAAPADGSAPTASTPAASTPTTPKTDASKADAAKTPTRANTSIRTVEADESGRFFVTGMAEPGASLRIYLNDTLVTTVTAAKDGSFGMTIEKGMSPGDYKIRVDDVASGTGQVLTRAEVPFSMAEKTPAASAPAVVAAAGSPSKSALPGATVPAAGSGPVTTSGTGGTATPASTQPASIEAPGAVSTDGAPPTAKGGVQAGAENVQTATASAPAQGASPASASSQASRAAPATPAAPGSQPVGTDAAKPTAATPPPSVAVIPEIRTTTIVQGDNLWRLSRKIYGQGIRYTWIYDANTDQIRNPNMIYPGQIFVTPEKKTQ